MSANGRTAIARRSVRYPFVVVRPFWFVDRPEGIATVILQSSSGGLYSGESLSQRIAVDDGAAAHVTSQASMVVHANRGDGPACQSLRLDVGLNAHLEYVSDPVIAFPDSEFTQRVDFHIAQGASAIFAEGILVHDPSGRDMVFRKYQGSTRIYDSGGQLLARDETVVTGDEYEGGLARGSTSFSAMGLVLAIAPDQQASHSAWCSSVNAKLQLLNFSSQQHVFAASGLLPNTAGVVCRILARDGQTLRAALEASWRDLHLLMAGCNAPPSRK